MTKSQALAICRHRYGQTAEVEEKTWVMETSGTQITMTYCWHLGVIRAVGKDWKSLVEQ